MRIEGLLTNVGIWVVLASSDDATIDEMESELSGVYPGVPGVSTVFGTIFQAGHFSAFRVTHDLA